MIKQLTSLEDADGGRLQIEAALEKEIPQPDREDGISHLLDAARYSLLGGGKRIRARLLLLVAEMLSVARPVAMPFAVAVEMIHAYSLIHDDLPAMDDDELRRGKPSCHIRYGEGMAILAGDFLLNRAMEILLREAEKDRNFCRAALTLAHASGIDGMIGGQALDLQSAETRKLSAHEQMENLLRLHRGKTAALLSACLLVPAQLASSDEKILACLRQLGDALGLAFQIKDDLLDCLGDPEAIGKSRGKDERDNKLTFVTLLGSEEAERLLEKQNERLREKISFLAAEGYETGALSELYNELRQRRF